MDQESRKCKASNDLEQQQEEDFDEEQRQLADAESKKEDGDGEQQEQVQGVEDAQQQEEQALQDLENLRIDKGKRPMTETDEDDTAPYAKRPRTSLTIIIEHCTSIVCNQDQVLKQKARKVKNALMAAGLPAGCDVQINPHPKNEKRTRQQERRKGKCFEVRLDTGYVVASFENQRRPFEKVSQLDVQEIVDKVFDSIQLTL